MGSSASLDKEDEEKNIKHNLVSEEEALYLTENVKLCYLF